METGRATREEEMYPLNSLSRVDSTYGREEVGGKVVGSGAGRPAAENGSGYFSQLPRPAHHNLFFSWQGCQSCEWGDHWFITQGPLLGCTLILQSNSPSTP